MSVLNITSSDILKIQNAVKMHDTIEFTCNSLTNEQKEQFVTILKTFLDACEQSHLFNCLSYCLLELLDNANKANIKRLFFQEKNLNINNEKDYEKGMKLFKESISGDKQQYFDNLKNSYLKISLQLSLNDIIMLKVKNNTQITTSEYNRINDKINKSLNYESISDAINDIDQTEGSGLGIISIILMLKKLGLQGKNIQFSNDENCTIATIEIPVDSFEEI